MQLTQLRNATVLLEYGGEHLLVDPMLSQAGALPAFRLRGGPRRRNPLTELPPNAEDTLSRVTRILVTHEHPDHLDPPAVAWIQSRKLPVWAGSHDVPNLQRKGLSCSPASDAANLRVEQIPGTHGHGLLGWLMGPVSGFFFQHPEEPSVYLTGDTVLTANVRDALHRLQPEVVIAPAGGANFGLGRDLLFSLDGLVELVSLAPGVVVFNHLESIDHCPITRQQLRETMQQHDLDARVQIPLDGDTLRFPRSDITQEVPLRAGVAPKPGFQKWLTSWFAGT